MRRLVRSFGLLFIVAALVAGGVAAWAYWTFTRPGPLDGPTTVIVPRGAGLGEVAALLGEAGVLGQPEVFAAAARLTGKGRSIRAGEYAFAPRVSGARVLDILVRGETVVRQVTIPEGLTTRQIVQLLENTPGLTGPAAGAVPTSDLPAEGTLLPETYNYSFGDSRRMLLDRMAAAMKETLAELWPKRAAGLPFDTMAEAVTLASIVEKETGIPEERPHVASVFINRLRRGMRLESDPTVVYAMSGGTGPLGRPLTRDDLKIELPHNTYVNAGLPPSPICNPGRASIAAVLDPAESGDLFFVADGTGGHAFARTLEEHIRNVAKWRRLQREQRREEKAQ